MNAPSSSSDKPDDIMLQREFDGFAAVALFKGHSDESKAKAERMVASLRAVPECGQINAAPQARVSGRLPGLPDPGAVTGTLSSETPAVAAPTPRTDALAFWQRQHYDNGTFKEWMEVVSAEECRKIERKLADMTAARDRTADLLREAIEENTRLRDAVSATQPMPERGPVAWCLAEAAINNIQDASIEKLVAVCKQAHYVDVKVRINGEDRTYQADWIKHLHRRPVSTSGTSKA